MFLLRPGLFSSTAAVGSAAGGGTPASVTIYSDGAKDGQLDSFDLDNAVVRAKTSADGADPGGLSGYLGWYNFGGTFYCDVLGLAFDTSSIPDGATITSVTLHIQAQGNGGAAADIQARTGYTWAGEVAVANQRTPAQFAALTLVATAAYDPAPGPLDLVFTSQAGFPAAINKSGYTYLWLSTATWAADTTTADDGYTLVTLGNDLTEANRPYLVIDYTA